MADNTTINDATQKVVEAAHGNNEPATSHDVTEGGIIGAVGGAVVGLLAGGPLGAVIGAIACGAASAAAVDVVDKHDHDYARTAGAGSENAASADAYAVPDTATAAAYPPPSTGAYGSSLTQSADGETVIPIVAEELAVGKRQVQSGGARIHTSVIETPVSENVTLHEEHVTVDRRAVDQPVLESATAFKEQNFEVTETNEVPAIAKEARVVEEVVVGKAATDRVQTIQDTVRRTEVEVDDLGTNGSANR